ncbi:MAG: rod-binding protein [Solirubrobacterales bacterium]
MINAVSNVGPAQVAQSGQARMEENKIKDFQAQLDRVLSEKDDKKLKQSCQDFEAVFAGMMLKAMRETMIPKTGLTEESYGRSMFQSMLDDEYANNMAAQGSLGLSQTLYDQLKFNMVASAVQPPAAGTSAAPKTA